MAVNTNHMEANIKSITVKDGIGREVNPCQQMIRGEDGEELSQDYYEFDISNNSYPCPSLANTKPGETVEAVLVWQERRFGEEWDNIDAPTNESQWTRQIYRLVPKEEKDPEQEMVNKSDVLKILEDARIMAVKSNSHSGDYAETVLYNIIQEIESLTPPTLK